MELQKDREIQAWARARVVCENVDPWEIPKTFKVSPPILQS